MPEALHEPPLLLSKNGYLVAKLLHRYFEETLLLIYFSIKSIP